MKPNILHHNGLGFVIIPKSGGTSVKTAVRQGMGLDESQRIHADDRLNYTKNPKGLKLVAFVRNPFDRLVSAYANKIQGNHDNGFERFRRLGFRRDMSFAEFVSHLPGNLGKEGHITRQSDYLPDAPVDLYRFEDMAEVWGSLREQHDWLPALPHENASGKANWQTYYSGDIRRLVSDLYRKDLGLWHSL